MAINDTVSRGSVTTTKIELLRGQASLGRIPPFVKAAALDRQIAIIQHTFRPDYVDMYFDSELYLRLVEFAEGFSSQHRVLIIDRAWQERGSKELELSDGIDGIEFLANWQAKSDLDRDAPECILVCENQQPTLIIVTEYWNQIGGPFPYADSYTYSIYSDPESVADLMPFLREVEDRHDWDLRELELQ